MPYAFSRTTHIIIEFTLLIDPRFINRVPDSSSTGTVLTTGECEKAHVSICLQLNISGFFAAVDVIAPIHVIIGKWLDIPLNITQWFIFSYP